MNDYGVNPELQKSVDREVLVKTIATKAQLNYEKKRHIARGKIADLAEAKRIEEYYF